MRLYALYLRGGGCHLLVLFLHVTVVYSNSNTAPYLLSLKFSASFLFYSTVVAYILQVSTSSVLACAHLFICKT